MGAADLLASIRASEDHAYSGYVETRGNIELPVTNRFTDVGDLFGGLTRMRVWWRGSDQWRVDTLLPSGEEGLIHDAGHTTEWSYEGAEATVYDDPSVRLPRGADLLPPAVSARLLDDVRPAEVTRLGARRLAGRDAVGLRLSPTSTQTSIDHADVWADLETGIPLAVSVHGDQNRSKPVFSAEFHQFSSDTPTPVMTAFTPPPGTDFSFDDVLDIADAANQFAPLRPPPTLAALTRSAGDRAVGVYGAGVTQLIAIPLRDREAVPLRDQLRTLPTWKEAAGGTVVTAGPLGILLTGCVDDVSWLIAGTVTEETLAISARQLTRPATRGAGQS